MLGRPLTGEHHWTWSQLTGQLTGPLFRHNKASQYQPASNTMFNAIQPKTPQAVLAGLQQHGASVGAKKLLQWEFRHAREALQSGVYVSLYNDERKYECTRLGKLSRCFCNHSYGKHKLKILKNGRFGKNPCQEEGCKCANFLFMW